MLCQPADAMDGMASSEIVPEIWARPCSAVLWVVSAVYGGKQ